MFWVPPRQVKWHPPELVEGKRPKLRVAAAIAEATGTKARYLEQRGETDRTTRIWLDAILRAELGQVVDWSRLDKEDYLLAMERSPVRDTELRLLLRDALTDRVSDRAVFMHGVDASYAYEGYTRYKTEEL